MRLTDRPKPLAEMKSDVQWAPQVQSVLDKALERDLNKRYQTSGEFGRDFFKAISGMRGSAKTRVMGASSLPPTSVPPDLAGVTHPIPATRVSTGTPPLSHAPIAAERKSKTPMIATIAAVAMLAVVGGGYAIMKNGNADARSAAQLQGDTARADTTRLNRQVAPPLDVDAELDAIGKLTDLQAGTPAMAAQALQRLDSLPSASRMTADQKVLAALLRAEANVNRENSCAAYNAVKDVEGASKGTRYEKRVTYILSNASCTKSP